MTQYFQLSAEIEKFYGVLNCAKKKPAILKITQPYAEKFIPKMCQEQFPEPMNELYSPEALKMTYLELLNECERVVESISVCSVVVCIMCIWLFITYCVLIRSHNNSQQKMSLKHEVSHQRSPGFYIGLAESRHLTSNLLHVYKFFYASAEFNQANLLP